MKKITFLLFCVVTITVQAKLPNEALQACLIKKLATADSNVTVKQLKQACNDLSEVSKIAHQNKVKAFFSHVIKARNMASEPYLMTPYVMTPHNMNYLLPLSYSDNINRKVYDEEEGWPDNLKKTEVKYQISFRIPLLTSSLFTEGDGIAFAFTLKSWWQLYAKTISRPFRETNYQPELFYYTPLNWKPLQGDTALLFGFEHQSNGRSHLLSRSWNRLYTNFVFAKDNYTISFKPWWRIPEGNTKTTATHPGDDNPDITNYMGHFELSTMYSGEYYDLYFKGRQNFKTHHGGVELGITFPIIERLKGYIQYTNGYGESMIDYNHSQQTIGIGFSLTDFFKD